MVKCVIGHPCLATTLQNTIVASDSGGNCTGSITDGGHDVTFGDASCPGTNGDPDLGQLADNGGPTETLALGVGSAAIDIVPATGAGCPATDQRGLPRPSGPACDAGAYEVTPPAAKTGDASAITTTGARVAASVTANAGDADVHFEYGLSNSYGSNTPVQHVAGLAPAAVEADLTGLTPGKTYHYRVVATSADGATNGADRTFTTTAAPALTSLKLRPKRFAPALSGASIARTRKVGTTVSYSDSQAATTTFTVFRVLGRKRVKSIGSFTHSDAAGPNRFTFTGRVAGRALRPGRYRLAATPHAGGVEGATKTVAFTVVARSRK
jgi:hypothetical protein